MTRTHTFDVGERARLEVRVQSGRIDVETGPHGEMALTISGRFDEDDLPSICDHLDSAAPPGDLVVAGEAHSIQPGTAGWAALGHPEVPQ